MKRVQRLMVLLLAAAVLLTLCSCSEKVKAEKINTKDYSRQIRIETVNGDVQIVHANKSTEAAKEGQELKSDDGLRVPAGGELVLNADGNKSIYVGESSALRLEASGTPSSGKTRVCLEEGWVMIRLDEPLKAGEFFEVQTDTSTVSIPEGITRVVKIAPQNGGLLLTEVFEGHASVVIRKTGEKVEIEAGAAVLVNEAAKTPAFVRSDEIDMDFWKSNEINGLKVGTDGTGSVTLPIPYDKLPEPVVEQLREAAEDGRELSVSETTLTNLIETGHDFVQTVMKEPTCTEDGTVSLECAICAEQREDRIPALGHHEEEIPLVEATCTESGLTAGTRCTVCGETVRAQEEVPALGHQEVEDPAVEATCTQGGKTSGAHCAVCGEVLTAQEEIPALGHQEVVDPGIEATCTEAGVIHQSRCAVCGEILEEERVVPALGHQLEEIPAQAATCEAEGLTAGSRCTVCGEVFEEQKPVPALGHQCEVVPGRAPTCTHPGLTDGQRCRVCNQMVEDQKTIPVLPHNIQTVSGKAATCSKEGYTESEVCTDCGFIQKGAETIPMLEHTPRTIPGQEPSCTRPGLTDGQRCAKCFKLLEAQKTIPMTAHTPETIPAVAPTCTEAGFTEGSRCAVCGEVLVAQEEIPALGHEVKLIPGVEPTCASQGKTEGQQCQVCNKILEWPTLIPKLPHTPEKVYGIYPMCFREGLTDGVVCSVCGFEIEPCQVIAKLPHKPGSLAGTAPTCTTHGWTDGVACQICSEIMVPKVKIPPTHTEGSTFRTDNPHPPLLNAAGDLVADANHPSWCYQITHVCSVCGEEYKVDTFYHVPGTVHTDTIGTEAACTQRLLYCGTCGKLIQRRTTGHIWQTLLSDPDEEGFVWVTVSCSICGFVLSTERA